VFIMPIVHPVHPNGRIELTGEQQAAVAQLLRFDKKEQSLGGYAGTGKSTVVAERIRRLPRFRVCAFTGKAADVLRRKGVPASTIHALIYLPVETVWLDDDGVVHRGVRWERRSPADFDGAGFIVDEASMVSRDLYNDLLRFDLPVIIVGDHGQLPPVAAGAFNPMADPDLTLETIHRHAGEIPRFAEFIRKGNPPSEWRKQKGFTGERVRFTTRAGLGVACADAEPDQTVCAFNKTRVLLNRAAREHFGYPADQPVPGDRVVCLQNDRRLGVFNGQQGHVVSVNPAVERLVFRADGHDYSVLYVDEAFNAHERPERDPHGRLPFDYCYAITVHKAQGDEFNHVLVVEEFCSAWEHCRWAYTAATRAREKLTWVTP
jgi:exodeoxyribonuclease-5